MRFKNCIILILVLIASGGLHAKAAVAREQATLRIGCGPHLFVDDFLVSERSGLTRLVYPCQKLPQPVLQAEKPWEGGRVYIYGSVFPCRQNGGLAMWYMSRGSDFERRDRRLQLKGSDLVLYATSKDGARWIRPDLGMFAFDGNNDNNIVFAMHSPSVLYDPADPDPDYRYKMLGHLYELPGKEGSGYSAAYSADGINWTLYPKNPVIPGADTITLSYNHATREYLAFYKKRIKVRGYMRRVVLSASSKDMQDWTDHGVVLTPDEEDDHWVEKAPQRTEFYNMSVFQRGGLFLGLVPVFRVEQLRERGEVKYEQSRYDGPIDVQLVHSRDARRWTRCDDRSPVIPRGPHVYDAGSILGVSNIPVIDGDRMWLYYTAMTTTHGGALPEKKMSIGRAAWRLDGMVSLAAEEDEAVLETVPLEFDGRRLTVNADASRGELLVELLDREGRPLPGYGAEDCEPIYSDGARHEIKWTNGSRLPDEMPMRIRFRLRNADLYSFSLP